MYCSECGARQEEPAIKTVALFSFGGIALVCGSLMMLPLEYFIIAAALTVFGVRRMDKQLFHRESTVQICRHCGSHNDKLRAL